MILSKIRKEIIEESKTWMGTKWQHQACVKGVAVDCAMLVAGIAKNVNLISDDEINTIPAYPKDWHFHQDFAILPVIMESMGCIEKDKNNRGFHC